MPTDYDLIVVGAGAAGLLGAARAAERGQRTLLLEKNRKPGVKILMSGGTRCNLTHDTDARGIVAAFGAQGKFLHSPLAALGPRDVPALFQAEGVPTKVEPGGKVFPASDKALDVQQALVRRLERSGAELAREEPALDLRRAGDGWEVVTRRGTIPCRWLMLTSGGQSYAGCGTTGDAYRWLAELGHTIVPPRPALAPLTSDEAWVHELSGLTIPDARVQVVERAAPAASKSSGRESSRASFLFTHQGLSGPGPMNVSREVTLRSDPRALDLVCDFLPDWSEAEVEQHLQERASGKRQVAALLPEVIPQRLAAALAQQAGIPLETRAAEVSKRQRQALLAAVKRQAIPLSGTRGFPKAEVTAGGVSLDEVDSRNLRSKLAPRLLIAGELLDLDGPIGGYNFQAAFSTGWLAGSSVE